MRFGKFSLAAVAAASLLSAPVMAQAVSTTSNAVGVSKVKRVGAASKDESKQAGSGVIIAIVAAVAVIGGIVLAAGNDDDGPTSP